MPDLKKFTGLKPPTPPSKKPHRPPVASTDLTSKGKPVIGPPENGPRLDEPP
jgi:hypothetical protein